MKLHRLTIRPTSLQLTPWQADTLFGTLCWAYRFREGEDALREFLEPFVQGDPPFLLSDAMPEGYFPVPLFLRVAHTKRTCDREIYRKEKLLKKTLFLPEEQFEKACRGEAVEIGKQDRELTRAASQLHASINRATGTTTSADDETGGNLFELHGWVPGNRSGCMNIYIADRRGDQIEQVVRLLRDVELSGFGKKKSSGMGAFRIVSKPKPWQPPNVNGNANGFVSLSGFVPAEADPTIGFWQVKVKHGKLGESYAVGGDPFKYPWIVLQAGACFATNGPPGEVYGRMIEGISPHYSDVVQYGFAFPVPALIPSEVLQKAQ